jgi:hypothetical protein
MSGVNIAFVTRAAEPCAAASRAHKQRRKTNYKLRFDDFKPKVGCNRPMYCLSEPKGNSGVAVNLPTWSYNRFSRR